MESHLPHFSNMLSGFVGLFGGRIEQVLENQEQIMSTLADIQSALAEMKTVQDEAVTLLQHMASNPDAATMQSIVDTIHTDTAALQSAVTAATPTPPPSPAPVPEPAPTP